MSTALPLHDPPHPVRSRHLCPNWTALLLAQVLLGWGVPHLTGAETILVFAAVSVATPLDALLGSWHGSHGALARGTYDASSVLARQIEQGAPAGLVICADERWMDELATKACIDITTRGDLLGNQLVLVAPAGHGFAVTFSAGFNLAAAFTGRLAITDPAVPLGHYAEQAFANLGWSASLVSRLLPAADAHAALRLVEMGETEAGVAYGSDAQGNPRVSVVGIFPEATHAPIRYPMAAVAGANPTVIELMAYLRSPAAAVIFRTHGFTPLAKAH